MGRSSATISAAERRPNARLARTARPATVAGSNAWKCRSNARPVRPWMPPSRSSTRSLLWSSRLPSPLPVTSDTIAANGGNRGHASAASSPPFRFPAQARSSPLLPQARAQHPSLGLAHIYPVGPPSRLPPSTDETPAPAGVVSADQTPLCQGNEARTADSSPPTLGVPPTAEGCAKPQTPPSDEPVEPPGPAAAGDFVGEAGPIPQARPAHGVHSQNAQIAQITRAGQSRTCHIINSNECSGIAGPRTCPESIPCYGGTGFQPVMKYANHGLEARAERASTALFLDNSQVMDPKRGFPSRGPVFWIFLPRNRPDRRT